MGLVVSAAVYTHLGIHQHAEVLEHERRYHEPCGPAIGIVCRGIFANVRRHQVETLERPGQLPHLAPHQAEAVALGCSAALRGT